MEKIHGQTKKDLRKKQHTVAQSYLQNFTFNGNQLYVFDKFPGETLPHPCNIGDVACERFFYDTEVVDQIMSKHQFVEKVFNNFFETKAVSVIKNILESIENKKFVRIHPQQRKILSEYLVFQFLRTKEGRCICLELYEKLAKKEGHAFNIPEDKKSAFHALALLNTERINEISSVLYEHIWLICENNTDNKLYTSDHPVVKFGHIMNAGFGSEGVEISFPLSPKYLLTLYEKSSFKELRRLDGEIAPDFLDENNVTHYNLLQVCNSYRQIFSEEQNFELAERICKENAIITKPERSRVIAS